jgi:short-subunit dehydrogenase
LDFSRPIEEKWAALESICNSLDISVLGIILNIFHSQHVLRAYVVNNVGKSHDWPVPFAQTGLEEMDGIVKINVYGTLRITRMILPAMLQRR